jgi:hypothetical protein
MLDRRPAHSSLTLMRRATRRNGIGAHLAGVAQPAEHLFCKQAVGGSTPPVSSTSFATTSEGCPSGQREQAVNLPAYAYVGSNPTPSTSFCVGVSAPRDAVRPLRSESRARRPRRFVMGLGVSVAPVDLFFHDPERRRGGAVAPRAAYRRRHPVEVGASANVSMNGAAYRRRHPVEVGASANVNGTGSARRDGGGTGLTSCASTHAGVAQLVEHQPSKLNVVGSSPISRSTELAHIAQLAERVLGKDEVTSSNLVVGSTRPLPHRGHSPRPAQASWSGPQSRLFSGPQPQKRFRIVAANPTHQEGSLE